MPLINPPKIDMTKCDTTAAAVPEYNYLSFLSACGITSAEWIL